MRDLETLIKNLIEKSKQQQEPTQSDIDPIDISIEGTSKGYVVIRWDKSRDLVVFSTPDRARFFARMLISMANNLEKKLEEEKDSDGQKKESHNG